MKKILFNKHFWSVLLLVVSFGYYAFQIDDSGETMDEWFHYFVSGRTMAAIKHFDFSPAGHQYRIDLPPVYKYIYGIPALLTNKFAPGNPAYSSGNLTYARLTSALLTSLTAIVVLWFGWEFLAPAIGIFSGFIFAFLPAIVAYAKVLSSDTPGVLFFTLSVYLFAKAIKRPGNNFFYLLTALSVGLTISSKYNNFLIFPLLASIFLIHQWKNVRGSGLLELPLNLFLIVPFSLFFFFAIWPWLWTDPFSHLIQSFDHWLRQGAGFESLNLQYFPVYFAITTPIVILILFGFFFSKIAKERPSINFVLLVWFLIPFLVTFSKYKIDGIRFVTAALVPTSLMAAAGLVYLVSQFTQQIKIGKNKMLIAVGLLTFAYLLVTDLRFHPYYLDYFNELVGGPSGASAKGIPVGFWGEGVKEAVDYVNKNAPKNSKIQFAVSQPNFIPQVRGDLVRLKPLIPDILKGIADPTTFINNLSDGGQMANFIIQYQVGIPEVEKLYDVVYQTKVAGFPIATVYKLK